MRLFDEMRSGNLERRETQLILFACSAIIVLSGGLALFMYPAMFSPTGLAPTRTMFISFLGFCVLSILLAAYLLERQATIGRLRRQLGEERRRASEALKLASAELVEALPNYSSFQDQLSMEYRRDAATKQNLSVLVITTNVSQPFSEESLSMSVLGDAAKAISRKLRDQDSICLLARGHFGVILPGVDRAAAERISARVVEGLTDAAGASSRFSFKVTAITYPEQVSSAHDLELAITDLLPEESLRETMSASALSSG